MPLVGRVPDGDGVSDEASHQQLGVPGPWGIVFLDTLDSIILPIIVVCFICNLLILNFSLIIVLRLN